MNRKKLIWLIITGLLAMLFFYTAASKLLDIPKFTWQINNQPFDNRLTPLLVYGIPPAEIITGLLMVIPGTGRAGYYSFVTLMSIFTLYVAIITFGGFPDRPCGCAAAFEHFKWWQHLVFNLGCLALAVWGLKLTKKLNL